MTYDFVFWRTFILSGAALGQTLFVMLYVTFPWWHSFLGRALFLSALTLAVLLDALVVSRWLGLGRNDALFIVLDAAMAAGVWAQLFAFSTIMRTSNREDRE